MPLNFVGGGSLSFQCGGQTLFNVSQCPAHGLPVPYYLSRPVGLAPLPAALTLVNVLDLLRLDARPNTALGPG